MQEYGNRRQGEHTDSFRTRFYQGIDQPHVWVWGIDLVSVFVGLRQSLPFIEVVPYELLSFMCERNKKRSQRSEYLNDICHSDALWVLLQVIRSIQIKGKHQIAGLYFQIVATGMRHTDSYTLSGSDQEGVFSVVLGHEGAGVVESVGKGITKFQPGSPDFLMD